MCRVNLFFDSAKSSVMDAYDSAVTFLYSSGASKSDEKSFNPPFEKDFNGDSEEVQLSSIRK